MLGATVCPSSESSPTRGPAARAPRMSTTQRILEKPHAFVALEESHLALAGFKLDKLGSPS